MALLLTITSFLKFSCELLREPTRLFAVLLKTLFFLTLPRSSLKALLFLGVGLRVDKMGSLPDAMVIPFPVNSSWGKQLELPLC